jgi:hypothetical protein
MVAAMRLLAVRDSSGAPTLWINADHLVSVQAVYRVGVVVSLSVELKMDGMPLQRVALGDFQDRAAAESAFSVFLGDLQAESRG